MSKTKSISLGFTTQRFPAGIHVCQIVNGDDEREDAVLKYLLSGLQAGERTTCFSENVTRDRVAQFLCNAGISCDHATASGSLTLAGAREIYFAGNRFDPERMLQLLKQYDEESRAQGYSGARVIGEMSPEVQHIAGGERLLEYEARVSILLRKHPVTSVCQYDARRFNGAVVMDILKMHALMVVRGSVVHNPFYVPPEEFLS